MKPLFTQYSGAQAARWAPFAKKKLRQLKERLGAVGLSTGRQQLDFNGVSIRLYTTNEFDRIRITAGSPKFFALFQTVTSPELQVYEVLVAYGDDDTEVWRIAFPARSLFPVYTRILLGCSADGTRVLVGEYDYGTNNLLVRSVVNGAIDAGASFSLSGRGISFEGMTSARVSLNGQRAVFKIGSATGEFVALYFDAQHETPVTEVRVSSSTDGSMVVGGSDDLGTAILTTSTYFTYTSEPAVSLSYVEILNNGSGLSTTTKNLALTLDGSSYVVMNDVEVSASGQIVAAYFTHQATSTSFGTPVTIKSRVTSSAGASLVLQTNATVMESSTITGMVASFSLRSVREDGNDFAYSIVEPTAVTGTASTEAGTYIDGTRTVLAAAHLALALSADTAAVVVQTPASHVVRTTAGDLLLADNPVGVSVKEHCFGSDKSVYAPVQARKQLGQASYQRWTPQTADGEIVGYGDPVTLGDVPASVTLAAGDPPVDLTLSRQQVVSVYPQLVV